MQFPTWTVPQGKLDDLALDERVYQVRRYFHLHLHVYLDSSIHHGMGPGHWGAGPFPFTFTAGLILPAGNTQETKRLVAAEMQHITYNEFLPAVLVPANNCSLKLYSLSLSRVTLKWQAMGWTMRIASLGKKGKLFRSTFLLLTKKLICLAFHFSESVDPGIFNSFATAAYRFGHSLVQSIFRSSHFFQVPIP